MQLSLLKKQLTNFLIVFLLAPFLIYPSNAYAVYDGPRTTDWNVEKKHCDTGVFSFDPGVKNIDVNWEFSNPVCASFISLQGAAIVGAGYATDSLCVPTNSYGRSAAVREAVMDSIPHTPIINPLTLYKLLSVFKKCGSRTGELAIANAAMASCIGSAAACVEASRQVGLAGADVTRCCTAYSTYLAAYGAGMSALGIIYASAKGAFENARICGHDWSGWAKVDLNGDLDPEGKWRNGKYEGSYQKCIEDLFINNINSCGLPDVDGVPALSIRLSNKYYREYLYGGKEYIDQGSDHCENPSTWSESRRISALGYSNDRQRYYMRGPAVASNYACHRFVLAHASDADKSAVNKAYECCKKRSQGTLCIENAPLAVGQTSSDYNYQFCALGDRCNVNGVWFETFLSKQKINYICGKTYSVCPYNHLIGGGTETEKFVIDSHGQPTSEVENFCQTLKHCVKVPVLPYIRISTLDGAYISSACKDMKGDSQNVYSFDAELLPISTRGFSAPLVQCFKETMENLLLNNAGDSLCRNPDESPDITGMCKSGNIYKKGKTLSKPSFFMKIQDNLQFAIKMTLTISVAVFGIMILLGVSGGQAIVKKQLLGYIVKIGFIMYFALGDGWQSGFVEGILSSSNIVSDIVMRLDDGPDPEKMDGCQFPRFNYAAETDKSRYENPQYPPKKEYLKIWDTLDCKLARAIGFAPDVSVPNLVKMILAGFLTGGLGIVFLVATFFFAFFMLSLILRAMHIFLMAVVAIITLIYVSPIMITLVLFSKTKNIFDGWWKQILGFALQPVILFAYLGIFISIFNNAIIGQAKFREDAKNPREVPKSIICDDQIICKKCHPTSVIAAKSDSAIAINEISPNSEIICEDNPKCTEEQIKNADPNFTERIKVDETSIYCIFRVAKLKTYSGLEPIGIGLPILANMNSGKLNTIMKAAFVMFIFSEFVDKISTFAAKLVGGMALSSKPMSAMAMTSKAYDTLRGIQKRGSRASKKLASSAARSAAKATKGYVNEIGNRGKSIAASEKVGGASVAGQQNSSGGVAGQQNSPGGVAGDDGSGSPSV